MRKLLAALLVLSSPAIARAAEPFARTAVESKGNIVPGQQVRLDVDILVPTFFTSPPQFPLFELPSALVTLPEERADNLTETVDGVRYSGIRKAYAIIPQAPGKFTIPEIGIDLGYSIDGRPTRTTVNAPSVAFEVSAPVSPAGTTLALVATGLTIGQSFDRDLKSLRAGDAIVRTITVSAEDTQAMVMPPVAAGTVDGLRQYAKPPRIEDGMSDGRTMVSRRTETYVYTAERSGSFVIPGVAYPWFDAADQRQKTASLPPIDLTIAEAISDVAIPPVLNEAPRQSPWVRRRHIAIAILVVLALLAVAYVARAIPSMLAAKIAEARARRAASPEHRLKLLRQTISTAKDSEIYQGLHAWSSGLGYRTLEQWSAGGSDELKRQTEILSRKLFASGSEDIDRAALARSVYFSRTRHEQVTSALPPLNPAHQDAA